MRKLYTLLIAVLLTANVFSQAPEKMSYQAVVRDGNNALVPTSSVGMQISILQGSATSTSVYVETQVPTSNANGLVSLEIGSGILVSGNFTTIDWANGPYFIKTETDPTGGTNYTITGTSQLMSVPYALHAKTAESINGWSPTTRPYFYLKGTGQLSTTSLQKILLSQTVDTLINLNTLYSTVTDEVTITEAGTYTFFIGLSYTGEVRIKRNGIEEYLLPYGDYQMTCSYGTCSRPKQVVLNDLSVGDIITFWGIGWNDSSPNANFSGSIMGFKME